MRFRRAMNGTCNTSTPAPAPTTTAPLPPVETEAPPPPPPTTEAPPPPPSTTVAPPAPEETGPPPLPDFPATFNNPIKPGAGADPWVIYSKEQDSYYLIQSADGGLTVHASRDLTQFAEHGAKVWSPSDGYGALWAPELHYINGDWYIYVAMQTTDDNNSHRMYVLKGTSQDPTQAFDLVGKVSTPDDNWAIDGTVMQYEPNGKLYFIWSGWTDPGNTREQQLYIAEMCSPVQICSDRVLLHEPKNDWQRSDGQGVNEGPEVLVNNGRTFLVYSAAGSWSDNYCLALMGIDGGADPMDANAWWRLDDRPVMWRSDAALAPGHASFTTDRDGTPYVVYHAIDHPGAGWGGRTMRTQSFGWNADSSPAFPVPVGFDVALPHPE
ncbi:Arabinanase/levansucrase/invertase [Exidia glandulosa HHB12029]|uniref:Arabinanase/levansucrase/invertase n=1 Tax=Exidia glandulosa HHB12029 TaxID=1314781 RepID=A0A165FQL8_EXIGL|nr:Arabinanase/levansucrase/invertase [Exidia glandulosa HHB12029]